MSDSIRVKVAAVEINDYGRSVAVTPVHEARVLITARAKRRWWHSKHRFARPAMALVPVERIFFDGEDVLP